MYLVLMLCVIIILAIVLGPEWTSLIIGACMLTKFVMDETPCAMYQAPVTKKSDVAPVKVLHDNSSVLDAILNVKDKILTGDELLSARMKGMAQQAQEAVVHRARFTSNNFQQYFDEELSEQENRHWWEDDSLDMQMDDAMRTRH